MKKLLCNSLIASVVAVVGATTFVSKAHAQTADIDFTATVGNTCTINKLQDGVMGVADTLGSDQTLSSKPDESSQGQLGQVEVNCNTSGVISVSQLTPTGTDANALSNAAGYSANAFVSTDSSDFDGNQIAQADNNTTGVVTTNGSAQTLFVHALASSDTSIPVGSYAFQTTVTVTPQ